MPSRMRWHLRLLILCAGESLIELGCGPGHALQSLLRAPCLKQAIGLDWSETMLAQAARRNRRALEVGRLTLVRGDFAKLPFDDEIADAVLAVNVVYFMTAASVGEARRVLRPGGRLVIYATHGSAMRRWPFAGRHSHRLFDRKRLAALLAEAGFARESHPHRRRRCGLWRHRSCSEWQLSEGAGSVIQSVASKRTTRWTTTADRAAVAHSRAARGTPAGLKVLHSLTSVFGRLHAMPAPLRLRAVSSDFLR